MIRMPLLAIFLNALFFSCNPNLDGPEVLTVEPKTDDKTTTIEVPKELLSSLKFDYNMHTNNPEFVKLETIDQSRIGRIDKLIAAKSSYVIADKYLANSVFFFDKNGKFLKRVNPVDGQASPLVLGSVTYDSKRRLIYVHFHNNDESYLHSYTEAGEFVGKHNLNGLYFTEFSILSDSSFAFFLPGDKAKSIINDYQLAFGNRDGKTQSVAFSFSSSNALSNFGYNYNLVSFDDYLLFSKNYSKYVFQASTQPTKIYPRFELTGGNSDSLLVEIDSTSSVSEIRTLLDRKFQFSGRVLPTTNHFYFEFTKKGERIGFFYSNQNGHIVGGRPEARLAVGDSLKIDYYSYPVTSFEDKFISVLDPNEIASSEKAFDLIRQSSNFHGPLRTKKLDSLLRALKANENPVLMIYQLRPF